MTGSMPRRLTSLLLLLACLIAGTAAASPPSAETIFRHALFGEAKLSPNGSLVAIRLRTKESRDRLAVLDLQTMKITEVASFDGSDVNRFEWVNDQRLVFNLTDRDAALGEMDAAPGLFAVNADASGYRPLVDRVGRFLRDGNERQLLPWNTFLLGSIGRQDSNEVFVFKPEHLNAKEVDYRKLQRLNTITGRVDEVESPVHSVAWVTDRNGELRIAVTEHNAMNAIHARDTATGQWTKLVEFEDHSDQVMTPLYLDDAGHLYVSTRHGRDTQAVYTYDLAARKLSDQPVIYSEKYDLEPSFVTTGGKVLGMRFTVDAETTKWLDPEMQALQKTVDRALPSTVNQISVAERGDGKYVLVHSYSDTSPGVFYLFNTRERKLLKLGSANPDIDPKAMSPMDPVRYKARDGLEIPAYLTLPNGAARKNLPMVVLVHGGPNVRGEDWGWNPEVQFLASRGYAVLQPEFRGSTGFGDRHFKAGWKQWGLAMQDDIADGVKWAIDQGIADPKRICIAGASYGGYAVLMGLAKDPSLYRCGVEWIGVTDINLLYTVRWSDASDIAKAYGMPKLVGDPVTDAAQLKATSPIENAAKIRAPLLMAYGGLDQRVPIIHGEKFRDAVKPHNPNVEWIVYSREGHGWRKPETVVEFWTRVERFLEAQIGKP